LAAASRKITQQESDALKAKFGKEPLEFKVALDGVAIYVNGGNPVDSLTVDQLADIFSGKVTNWSQVGGKNTPINLYSRDNNSGTYAFLKEHVLKGQEFAPAATVLPGSLQIIAKVGMDPGALGYGSIEFAKGIKHLKISAGSGSPAITAGLDTIR